MKASQSKVCLSKNKQTKERKKQSSKERPIDQMNKRTIKKKGRTVDRMINERKKGILVAIL